MDFDGNFRHIGELNNTLFDEIKDRALNITNEMWDKDSCWRRRVEGVHAHVKTYFVKFNYELVTNYENAPPYDPNDPFNKKPEVGPIVDRTVEWDNIINSIMEVLSDYYGKPLILGGMLFAKLSRQQEIRRHTDAGDHLSKVHRIHIPITTNKKVFFEVGEECISMNEGYLYEINNMRDHHVENNSNEDRINIIIDVLEK